MTFLSRLWPRSLQGQLLLAVALALLAAQAINGALLFRSQAERRDNAMVHTVGFRLYAALRDDRAERPLRRMRRPGPEAMLGALPNGTQPAAPTILAADRRLPEMEATLREMLGNQDIAIAAIQVVLRPVRLDLPAQRRVARRAANGELRLPAEVIVAAVQPRGVEGWTVVRVLVPPAAGRPGAALVIQTLVIFALLVGVIALVLRRLTRPLTALTRRVEHFAATRDASDPLPPSGPADLRQLIAAHNALEARIAALLDEKDVMLGAIGHDLKTPLAALRVRIESVTDETERQRMAATIDDLARSLDDILSLARVGRPSDPIEMTDLTALIAQVVEEYEDMGEPVTFTGAERIALPLRPTWLRRALRNLIGNAVRYGAVARVGLTRTGSGVTITVDDDGPGIAPADLARMMEPFTRGEPSRNRGTGGAGLGLALARAIAEQHGGALVLANRSGKDGTPAGLTATLRLPSSAA